jgi:hypothetical protein
MSIMRCNDCNTVIDTDDCPELSGPAKELLCESCADDALWCSKCRKRCEEVESEQWETDEFWGAVETRRRVYMVSECCGVATERAGEYAS